VYRATWRNAQVAQKQLLNMATIQPHELQDFLQEVSILQGLRPHPNLVLFLGITVRPLSLVTEFCAGGGLYTYLHKNTDISNEQKRKFIQGIALGMYHLHKENVIHRDLAARNILLTAALEPKVADFGLSRTTESSETGAQTTSNVGPLKWMAPEAINNKQYSNKSDVYSFSMTMWEIFTQQELYEDLSAVNAAIAVTTAGLRPPNPEGADPELVQLMIACYQELPQDRPDFGRICSVLNGNATLRNASDMQSMMKDSKQDLPSNNQYQTTDNAPKLFTKSPSQAEITNYSTLTERNYGGTFNPYADEKGNKESSYSSLNPSDQPQSTDYTSLEPKQQPGSSHYATRE